MTDPDAQPQHPTPHSEETADVATAEVQNAVPRDAGADPGAGAEDDVDPRPMSAPGGVNTEVDRIFGDDSPR